MKRFLRDLLGFASIQAGLLIGLWWVYQPDASGYLASSIDKHALLERAGSPRLILVGGSNVAFGFDSQLLEQRLGLNPVNMGLHASVGMRFMLQEVQPYLRPGDVVVVSPEYEQFATYSVNNGLTLLRVLEHHPRGMELFSVDWLPTLLDDSTANITGQGGPVLPEASRSLRLEDLKIDGTSPKLLIPPQTMKFHDAPCHKPLSPKVISTLHNHRCFGTRLPPKGT